MSKPGAPERRDTVVEDAHALFEHERREIFGRRWVCAAPAAQLASTGSYVTVNIGGHPVLIVRDETNTLRAMTNRCAHRGVELMRGDGQADELMCRHHGWTFGLDGRLTDAPQLRYKPDLRACRLPLLPCMEQGDVVFCALALDAVPPAVAPEQLCFSDFRLADSFSSEIECGWKQLLRAAPDLEANILPPNAIIVAHSDRKELRLIFPLSETTTRLVIHTFLRETLSGDEVVTERAAHRTALEAEVRSLGKFPAGSLAAEDGRRHVADCDGVSDLA